MSKRIYLILISLGAAGIIFHNCTRYKLVPNLCFRQDILPVFVSKCGSSGCHNGDSSGRRHLANFTTYEGILSQVTPFHPLLSDAYTKCSGISPSMPPSDYPQLTDKELEYIKYWIHVGARNDQDCGASSCDTVNVSFRRTVKPLMDNWCLGCHSSSNAGGGYDFSSYAGVKASITNNRLSGSINHLAGFSAMPQGGGMLDICDLRAIQNWIDAGYPDN
jgi:hypothetical protein